jgi:hypothetical protein
MAAGKSRLYHAKEAREVPRGDRRTLRVLARKEPDAISNLARDVADELELPGNPMMLEFLTGAEALLSAEGTAPEKTVNC